MALRSLSPLPSLPLSSLASLGAAGTTLAALLSAARGSIVCLSGAGLSTAAGIPDYRSPTRPAYRPLQNVEFIRDPAVRRRYWARSMTGWDRFSSVQPTPGHLALTALQRAGAVTHVITQNVDRLHTKAGAAPVLELHGCLHELECCACGAQLGGREALQREMLARNAGWSAYWAQHALPRPDGDVELPEASYADFSAPRCSACGADMVKPCVTFHGGSVPAAVTAASLEQARGAALLLVVGSTLSTFSALRLCKATVGAGGKVAIVNHGATRADDIASVLVGAHIDGVLEAAAREMGVAASK